MGVLLYYILEFLHNTIFYFLFSITLKIFLLKRVLRRQIMELAWICVELAGTICEIFRRLMNFSQ